MNPVQFVSSLEAKVAAPAVATGLLSTLVVALARVADAYGWDPSDEQRTALAALGIAALAIVNLVVGYYAPHTPRPELAPAPSAGDTYVITDAQPPADAAEVPEPEEADAP